tara:strand:+ start:367 stop:579 length:213 start_codon:yes stop_codon:yes gene_type:complete
MSKYRGSKIFNGTVVLGNMMKLLNGNIGIILGKLIIIFYKSNIIKLYYLYNDFLDSFLPQEWKHMASYSN